MKLSLGFLCAAALAIAAEPFHITHEFANRNAQSVIGLPMGSHKTIVDTNGNLRWSQWSLKRKPLDSPFGFSNQMDGALDILTLRVDNGRSSIFQAQGQSLFEGRYPFVVTRFEALGARLEEVAFAAQAGTQGLDVVRVQVTNDSTAPLSMETQLTGKHYNLPGDRRYGGLLSKDGFAIALPDYKMTCPMTGLGAPYTLDCRWTAAPHATTTVYIKIPYDLPAGKTAAVAAASGESMLAGARQAWQTIWAKAPQLHLPQKELEDFFYSSLADTLVLTEYDANNELWILDGPGGYRQFWGRGEYFQARTLQLIGRPDLAASSLDHAFRIQFDDGEWDGPPISGWPSWDNIGGNAAGTWEHYQFTHDRAFLTRAYPHLLAAARWIKLHREESALERDGIPEGAKPVRRAIPWSCKTEAVPTLKPGDPLPWQGLLPWAYGDSGIPEGHAFAHNFFTLYAEQVAAKAARQLGKTDDAKWLDAEIADYSKAIHSSIDRALPLEAGEPKYLPAMPLDPEAAWSQSFAAIYPTEFLKPGDPLVSGLLTRVEHSMQQGLPVNMAWLGFGGVWPGNSMNVAETYLRRGDVEKTANLLLATLNHSYTTNVWREEIRVDKTVAGACPNSNNHKDLDNQMGTGDMPEAWGNANLVNLVRDMLLLEQDGALQLLPGIPAGWIAVGDEISLTKAPTILGAPVSVRLTYPATGKMVLTFEAPTQPVDVIARFPLPAGAKIKSATAGRTDGNLVKLDKAAGPHRIEITF